MKIIGETKKLYMYKVGIQVGYEEYRQEISESGISIQTLYNHSGGGSTLKQFSRLFLDNEYNTLTLEVESISSVSRERYSFTYKDSEAHIWVDQESRTPNWEGKKVDKKIIWDHQVLVIPTISSFYSYGLLAKRYSYEKKGKQDVGCGIVPKLVFGLEYLGDDELEVGDRMVGCKRFLLTSSKSEAKAIHMWINEDEEVYRFLNSEKMLSMQSFKME